MNHTLLSFIWMGIQIKRKKSLAIVHEASRDVYAVTLDCANLTTTAASQYLSPSLLQEVKERYDNNYVN